MELASLNSDMAMACEIKHDDKLTDEDGVYIQVNPANISPSTSIVHIFTTSWHQPPSIKIRQHYSTPPALGRED